MGQDSLAVRARRLESLRYVSVFCPFAGYLRLKLFLVCLRLSLPGLQLSQQSRGYALAGLLQIDFPDPSLDTAEDLLHLVQWPGRQQVIQENESIPDHEVQFLAGKKACTGDLIEPIASLFEQRA
jgi:hypothetical protein